MVDLCSLTAALSLVADGTQALPAVECPRYPNEDYLAAARNPGRFYPDRVWNAAGALLGSIPVDYRWLLEHTGPLVVAEEFRILDILRQGKSSLAHYLALLNESSELEGVCLRFGAGGLVPWGSTGSGDVLCWRLGEGETHSVVVVEDDCCTISEDSGLSIGAFLLSKFEKCRTVMPFLDLDFPGEW